MFEGLIASLVSKYLGDYLVGFDKDNLGLSLTSGNVDLRDVEIKADALSQLRLPLDIRYGRVGQLHISIPWYSLTSSPVVVRLSQLHLVAAPNPVLSAVDPDKQRQKQLEQKRMELDVADMMFDPALQGKTDASSSSSSSAGFLERLATKIVSNVQIFIEDVHVRFEDDTSTQRAGSGAKQPFVLGAVIGRLVVQSTDAAWLPGFVKEYQPVVYKLLSLEHLAVYMHHVASPATDFYSRAANPQAAFAAFSLRAAAVERHLLVRPVCATLRLSVALRQRRDAPRVHVACSLGNVDVAVEQLQYVSLMQLLDFMQGHRLRVRYRALRPDRSVHAEPRAWWRFAIAALTADVRDRKRRWSLAHVHTVTAQRRDYMRLYKLKRAGGKPFDKTAQQQLAQLEDQLDYDVVVIFRSLAVEEMRREQLALAAQPSPASNDSGWRKTVSSWLWGSKKDQPSTPSPSKSSTASSSTVSSSSSTASTSTAPMASTSTAPMASTSTAPMASTSTGSSSELVDATLLSSAVVLQLNVSVSRASLVLRREQQHILDVTLREMDFALRLHQGDAFHVEALLRTLTVADQVTRDSPLQLVSSGTLYNGDELPLVSLVVDGRPPDSRADVRVRARLQPLLVVLSPCFVRQLLAYFMAIKDSALDDLKGLAEQNLVYWSNAATAMLAGAVDKPKRIELDLALSSPVVVLPSSFTAPAPQGIRLNVGDLTVRTDTHAWSAESPSSSTTTNSALFYEKFDVAVGGFFSQFCHLDAVSFLPLPAAPAWPLIQPVDLQFAISIARVPVAELPKVKIIGVLPSVSLVASVDRLSQLLAIVFGFVDEVLPALGSSSSSSSSSSSLPTPPTLAVLQLNKQAEQLIQHPNLLELAFSVGSIALLFESALDQPLASLALSSLTLGFAEHEHRRELQFSMGGLHLEDCKRRTASPHQRYLIEPPVGRELVAIRYASVPSTAPSYAGVDHELSVQISSIAVNVNPPLLSDLADAALQLQRALQRSSSLPPVETSAPATATAVTESSPGSSVSIVCLLQSVSVSLLLPDDQGPLIVLSLSQVQAAVSGRPPHAFQVQCSVKALDCVHQSLLAGGESPHLERWSHVLRSQGEHAFFQLVFETFQPPHPQYAQLSSTPPWSQNASLRLRLGHVRTIATTRLLAELAAFFDRLHHGITEALGRTAQLASDAINEQTNLTAQHDGKFTHLSVGLVGAFLIVPLNLDAPATPYLVLEVAQTSADSALTLLDAAPVAVAKLAVGEVNLKSYFTRGKDIDARHVLAPAKLQARLILPLAPGPKKLDVSLATSRVAVSANAEQLELIVQTAINGLRRFQNHSGRSLSPPPDSSISQPSSSSAASSPANSSSADPPLIAVSVSVPELALSVSDAQSADVLTLSLCGIQAGVLVESPSQLSASASLAALHVRDQLAQPSPVPLLTGTGADGEQPFLRADYTQSSTQRLLKVDVARLALIVVPGSVVDALLLFLLPVVERLQSQLANGLAAPAPPAVATTALAKKEDAAVSTQVELSLHDMRVAFAALLTPASAEGSVALSLLLSAAARLRLDTGGAAIELDVNGVRVVSESLGSSGERLRTGSRLLSPVDMSLRLRQSGQPSPSLELELNVPSLELVLGYRELRLLLHVSEAWTASLQRYQQQRQQQQQATTSAVAAVPQVALLATSDDSVFDESSLDGETETSVGDEGVQILASARIARLTVYVINNCPSTATSSSVVIVNAPLLRCCLADVSFEFTQNPPLFGAVLAVPKLEADFFNTVKDHWEPLLESWSFDCGVAPGGQGLGVSFRSSSVLEFTVTSQLLRTLVECGDAWLQDMAASKGQAPPLVDTSGVDPALAQFSRFHLYHFVNGAGVPLQYWLQSEAPALVYVPPGGASVIESQQRDAKKLSLLIECADDLVAPVTDIALSTITSFPIKVPLRKRGDGKAEQQAVPARLQLFWDVHVHQGARQLRVTSILAVHNRLSVPVRCQLLRLAGGGDGKRRGVGAVLQCVELAPDAVHFVPVLAVDGGAVQVQPAGDMFDWSQIVPFDVLLSRRREWDTERLKQLRTGKEELAPAHAMDDSGTEKDDSTIALERLQCPAGNGRPPFVSCVYLQQNSQSNIKLGLSRQTLTLYHPLIVENRLICTMELRLLQRTEQRPDDIVFGPVSIGRARELTVSCYQPGTVLMLQVRIKNYPSWSSPVPVTGKRPAAKLLLHDNLGRPLKLRIDNACFDPAAAVRRVTVYCPTWIINRSGLALRYRHVGGLLRNAVEAAGQQEDSYEVSEAALSRTTSSSSRKLDWFTDCPRQRKLQSRPFMVSGGKLAVQVRNYSGWSPALRLNKGQAAAVQTSTILQIRGNDSSDAQQPVQRFELSVSLKPGPGSFWRTQLVTFESHIVIVNNTGATLLYQQVGTSELYTLDAGAQSPFHWPDGAVSDEALLLRVRAEGHTWSSGFPVDHMARFQVKMTSSSSAAAAAAAAVASDLFFRIQIVAEDSTLSVIVDNDAALFPEYLVDNRSSLPVYYRQHGVETKKGPPIEFAWTSLPPRSSNLFVWDEPSFADKRVQLRVGDSDRLLRFVRNPIVLEKLRVYRPYFPDEEQQQQQVTGSAASMFGLLFDDTSSSALASPLRERQSVRGGVLVEVAIENTTKVLRIRNLDDVFADFRSRDDLRNMVQEYRRMTSAAKKAKRKQLRAERASSSSGDQAASSSSSPDGSQSGDPTAAALLEVGLNLAGVGVSVVNDTPQELAYVRMGALSVTYVQTLKRQSVELKLESFQIDNQMPLSPYPILFRSVPAEGRPFVHCSVIRSTVHQTVNFFHYLGVGVQEMEIKVDEAFLFELLYFSLSLLRYLSARSTRAEEHALLQTHRSTVLSGTVLPLPSPSAYDAHASAASSQPVQPAQSGQSSPVLTYFDLFQLNSIKATLSFMTLGSRRRKIEGIGPVFGFLLDIGGIVANLEDATIKFNGLMLKNPLLAAADLASVLQQHYTNQTLRALGGILGSADAFGNPKALFVGIGTGFKDFFVEPAVGFVSSPSDFGRGIAKGTSSLFKNTLFSLTNTTQKLGETVSKALVTVAFDADWKKMRDRAQRKRAKNLGHGLVLGAKELGAGVLGGAVGVIAEPIKGAAASGATGFVAGVGRGAAGFFLKPTAGTIDFIARTAEGVKTTTTSQHGVVRVRNPRWFGADRLLRPFDATLAAGQRALTELTEGRHHREIFVWWSALHLEPRTGRQQNWLLLSNETLFHLQGNPALPDHLHHTVDVKWRVELHRIGGVHDYSDAIQILLKNASPFSATSGPSAYRASLVAELGRLVVEHQQITTGCTLHDAIRCGTDQEELFRSQRAIAQPFVTHLVRANPPPPATPPPSRGPAATVPKLRRQTQPPAEPAIRAIRGPAHTDHDVDHDSDLEGQPLLKKPPADQANKDSLCSCCACQIL